MGEDQVRGRDCSARFCAISSSEGAEVAGCVCAVTLSGMRRPYNRGDQMLITAAAIRSVFPVRLERAVSTFRMIRPIRLFKFPPETPASIDNAFVTRAFSVREDSSFVGQTLAERLQSPIGLTTGRRRCCDKGHGQIACQQDAPPPSVGAN